MKKDFQPVNADNLQTYWQQLSSLNSSEFLQQLQWQATKNEENRPLRQAAVEGELVEFFLQWRRLWQNKLPPNSSFSFDWKTAALWTATQTEERSTTCRHLLGLWRKNSQSRNAPLLKDNASTKKRTSTKQSQGRRASSSASSLSKERLDQAATKTLKLFSDVPSSSELWLAAGLLLGRGLQLTAETFWQAARLLLQWNLLQQRSSLPNSEQQANFRSTNGLHELPDAKLVQPVELSLVVGVLFPGLAGSVPAKRCGEQLGRLLQKLADENGAPQALRLSDWLFWVAPFVRVKAVQRRLGLELWSTETEQRLQNLVEKLATLSLPDGRVSMSSVDPSRTRSLLPAAAQLGLFPPRSPAKRYVLETLSSRQNTQRCSAGQSQGPTSPSSAQARNTANHQAHFPSWQSDSAALACLRTDWSDSAAACVVAHDRSQPELFLAVGKQPLLQGAWTVRVKVSEAELELNDSWECVCWHSDEDADYIELQQELEHVTVERQLLLARTVGLAVLADAVKVNKPTTIEYEGLLPVPSTLTVVDSQASPELCLKAGRRKQCRVFPLFLSNFFVPQPATDNKAANTHSGKADRWPSALKPNGATVTVKHAAVESRALYVPLVFVWEPALRAKPAFWRSLTVSENRRTVAPEVAVAFRLQVGNYQLVVYRSLKHYKAARAFLGHQTRYETVIGRFDTEGEVLPLVMVE